MQIKALALAASLISIAAAPAFAKSDDKEKLVDAARGEAAWHGVEVERIKRYDQTLHISGRDRQGRSVTLAVTCASLAVECGGSTPVGTAVPTN